LVSYHADDIQPLSIAQAEELAEGYCESNPAYGEAYRQLWQFCDAAEVVEDGGHDVGDDCVVERVEEDADQRCEHD
jgi:hypothetical protein